MSYITAISPISRQRRNTLSHKWNSREESGVIISGLTWRATGRYFGLHCVVWGSASG